MATSSARSRVVCALVFAAVLSGCNAPKGDPDPTPTGTTRADGVPGGEAFDAIQWEEPSPPRADRMVASVSGEWEIRVVGQPGAVRPDADVLVGELGAGRGAIVRSGADGSFEARVVGGEGATIQVGTLEPNVLPPGENAGSVADRAHQVMHAEPSTYVRVPFSTPGNIEAGERPVAATGHFPESAPWRFVGSVHDQGSTVRVHGEVRLRSGQDLADLQVVGRLSRVFDEAGSPIPEQGAYATLGRTASGLPLEGETKLLNPAFASEPCEAARETPATLLCQVDLQIPAGDVPPGGYVVRIFIPHEPLPSDVASPPPDRLGRGARNYQPNDGVPLTLLARGMSGPMRPATLLLVDAPAQGTRGVQAVGDDAAWGWTNRILWQPTVHVTPRTDAAGAPIAYTLEPYLPQVYLADRDSPGPPLIDLSTPGGSWKVTIEDPQGGRRVLGPAPFEELVSRTATTRDGGVLNSGGGNVNGVARLATLSDDFRHTFARDGLHRISIEGSLDDVAGNDFVLGGTFEVLIAEPMDLDLGTLPGTPLVVGEPINRAVQVHPPLPAEITYRLRAWTGPDARLSYDTTTTGKASRFGWFHDHAHDPSTRISEAGEYRVDVTATYTGAGGKLWSASVTFGGVIVDPVDALEVHGRRGIDLKFQDQARFARSDTGLAEGGNHFNFPYHSGDVAWQTDADSMEIRLTINDPSNDVAPLFLDRTEGLSGLDPPREDGGPWEPPELVSQRFADGHGPLYRTTASGRDVRLGAEVDRFGYFYGTVERPGVRVRETAKEDLIPNGYWRFNEMYSLQPGMGPKGDLPNDYKFLFGGAVLRAPGQGLLRTGGYASLWVETPQEDARGSRVDSPFAPSATPLFTFQGEPVRAFFDPTGIRPGTLLVEGDVADFGGYLVPLGAQSLFLNVTRPSGEVQSFVGRSNPWGHLHDTAMNFVVDEPGVWRVDVRVKACPSAADSAWPCVEGGLNDGSESFVFYVATRDAPPIAVGAPEFLTEDGNLRAGDLEAATGGHATAWMSGWLVEARPLSGSDPVVLYEPERASARLPNFDVEDESGPTLRTGFPDDEVTFTALASYPDGTWRGAALDAWGARLLANE